MKRPQITPGPWHDTNDAQVRDSNSRIIADTESHNYRVRRSDRDEEDFANARAIASLPALLEALELFNNRLDSVINGGHCMAYADAVSGAAGSAILDNNKIKKALALAGYEF